MAHIAPINLADPMPTGIRAGALMTTSRDGWIERAGRLEGGRSDIRRGRGWRGSSDVRGRPRDSTRDGVGVLGRAPARIVVLGDSDFLSNGLLSDGPGNTTLALSESVHWASGADARVSSVGARRQKVRRLAISAEHQDRAGHQPGLLPVLFGLIGMAVRSSRRGR